MHALTSFNGTSEELAREYIPSIERHHILIDPLDIDAMLEEWTDDITGVNDPDTDPDMNFQRHSLTFDR